VNQLKKQKIANNAIAAAAFASSNNLGLQIQSALPFGQYRLNYPNPHFHLNQPRLNPRHYGK
jgi:hypothetical protein